MQNEMNALEILELDYPLSVVHTQLIPVISYLIAYDSIFDNYNINREQNIEFPT